MEKARFPDWVFTLVALVVAFAAALFLRVVPPFSSVFAGPDIRLTGIDAYFYMRLVDNLVHNFPLLMRFDPYGSYPAGFDLSNVPAFYAYLTSAAVKLLGGSNPSQQTVDTIAVYIPAILGALTVIPAFFLARALANRWAGLFAALLLALMPGEFLGRSLLGNTDHHVAETLFTSFFIMFFVLAIQHGRQFTYAMLRKGQWPPASRHVPYALFAGIFLGFYLITWQGALMFVFIIFVYFFIQFVSDHLRSFPTDYLSKIAIITFLVAMLIFLPFSRDKTTLLCLAAVVLIPIALNAVSSVMAARDIRPAYYLLAVAGLVLAGGLLAWALFPAIISFVLGYLGTIFGWRTLQMYVGEMKPLFFPGGFFTLEVAWSEYSLALYTGLAGLAALLYLCVRKGRPEHILTAVCSIVLMLASFSMVRFSAYFAVCLAVLTGFLGGWLVDMAAPVKDLAAQEGLSKKAKKATRGKSPPGGKRVTALLVASLMTAVVLAPGAAVAVNAAGNPAHVPPDGWMEALAWLKKNTPEPFGRADYYYELYKTPGSGQSFDFPGEAYSVLAWADYGYWITRQGRRAPFSNPGSGSIGEARYFTAQTLQECRQMTKSWGTKYVVVDSRIASPNDKFYALANLSGTRESDYYELCWQKKEGRYVPLLVFYPAYYRAMVSRLYNFDGKAVIPQATAVMAYQERTMPDGQKFKEITGLKNFRGYGEAEMFAAQQPAGTCSIIGTDPLNSPVPLAGLDDYRLVLGSKQTATVGTKTLPAVKVFEYRQPDMPLAGDWNGDGKTEVGIWQPAGAYFLLDYNGDGRWDAQEGDLKLGPFGHTGDVPVAGDWTGDGKSRVGVWRPADRSFYLDINGNGSWDPGKGDIKFELGNRIDDMPVTGDWGGAGRDNAGTSGYMSSKAGQGIFFYVDYAGRHNDDDLRPFGLYGGINDLTLAGDWNGDRKHTPGLYRQSDRTFMLDVNGDGRWEPDKGDLKLGPFGGPDDVPLSGDWTGTGRSNIGTWNPHDRCFYLDVNGDGKWGEGDKKLGPFGE